jgi:glucokinase
MSRRAIRRAYADATGGDPADVREICERARREDPIATRTLRAALYGLGAALGPWFSRFDAEIVVVGGSMTASWDILEQPFLDGFASVAALVPVAVAQDADRAPLLGAAYHAQQVS